MERYDPPTDVVGGPVLRVLEHTRVTYEEFAGGTDYHTEGSWEEDPPMDTSANPWVGCTIFYEVGARADYRDTHSPKDSLP